MLCSSTSLRVQDIPACTASIVAGTIANVSASLNAKFYDATTGRNNILNATSDGAGLVTISIDEPLPVNHALIVSIYLASDQAMTTPLNITIEGETGNELLFSFIEAYVESGANQTVTTTTLTL